MMYRRALAGGALALVLMTGVSSSGSGSEGEQGEVFLVSVFDCYVPIPNEFVLHTNDPSSISLSLRSSSEVVNIVISEYKENLDEAFRRTKVRTAGRLVVETFSVTRAGEAIRVTRLHDEKQQLMVYMGGDQLVESLTTGCRDLKHGMLYEK